jgi:hypothetical protein
MSTIRRHKIAYKQGLDALAGDSDTTSLISSAVAELAKTGGGLAAQYQASEEAKKSAAAAKKAAAPTPEQLQAQQAADAAKKAAAMAAIDAQEAADKANAVEQDPNGPLHKVASDKKKLADLAAVAAKSAMSKLAYFSPSTGLAVVDSEKGKKTRSGGGSDMSWLMYALGGVAVIGGGFLTYKLLRGRK